jgi:hypothetical protein
MGSADLYGQIDLARQRWKDAAGYIEPVHLDSAGRPMCPLCRAGSQQQELHQLEGGNIWSCRHNHSFLATVLHE